MITIPDKSFNSSIKLGDVLYVMKKDELLKIAKRLDFYVSPNVNKDKTATRLAASMLEEPIEIVSRLSKTELLLLEELIKAGPNTYIEKKWRKSLYMLQKWGLVLTYEDEAKGKRHQPPRQIRMRRKVQWRSLVGSQNSTNFAVVNQRTVSYDIKNIAFREC